MLLNHAHIVRFKTRYTTNSNACGRISVPTYMRFSAFLCMFVCVLLPWPHWRQNNRVLDTGREKGQMDAGRHGGRVRDLKGSQGTVMGGLKGQERRVRLGGRQAWIFQRDQSSGQRQDTNNSLHPCAPYCGTSVLNAYWKALYTLSAHTGPNIEIDAEYYFTVKT